MQILKRTMVLTSWNVIGPSWLYWVRMVWFTCFSLILLCFTLDKKTDVFFCCEFYWFRLQWNYCLKPMNRYWSQIQFRKILMSIPGILKVIHVAKFSPVSGPYKLHKNPIHCINYRLKRDLDVHHMIDSELINTYSCRIPLRTIWGPAPVWVPVPPMLEQ